MVSPKFAHFTKDRTANSCFNIIFHFHTFLLPSGQTLEARDEKKKDVGVQAPAPGSECATS